MNTKRYDPECEYIGSGEYLPNMKEDANGDYVLASDYDALHAELARVKSENAELREEFEFRRGVLCDSLTAANAENAELMVASNRVAQNLMNELAAANATLDRLREVVNQNEWDRAQKGDVLSQFQAILYPKETTDAG